MYIVTQLIAFTVVLVVFVIWLVQRKTNSAHEDVFAAVLLINMASFLLDALCQVAIANFFFDFSDLAVLIINKLYLFSIPLSLVIIVVYAVSLVANEKKVKRILLYTGITMFIDAVTVTILPIYFEYDPVCSLPLGAAVTYTYVAVLAIIVVSLFMLIKNKKTFNRYQFLSFSIWLGLLALGGILQFILLNTIKVPVVSFVYALGVVILFFVVENPGNRYNYQKNLFHHETFINYISERINSNDIQSLLFIHTAMKEKDNGAVRDFMEHIVSNNFKNTRIKIFKGSSSEIIITSKDIEELQELAGRINEYAYTIEEKYDNQIELLVSIVLIPSIDKFNSYRILRSLLNVYRIDGTDIEENIKLFVISDHIIERFNNEIEIVGVIEEAIKYGYIKNRYQLLKSLEEDGKIRAELATYIYNAEGRMLSTNEYVEVANKYGRILQIDEISFEQLCDEIGEILKEENKLDYILIRVSVQALEDDLFVAKIVQMVEEKKVDTKHICIEITNANAILKKEVLLKNIAKLQDLGFIFAMGGFGAGESNLNYFIDLPMNIVKYDHSILLEATKDERAAMIMQDITDLAHSLGFKVVAVGANTDEEKKLIKDCGVEMMIGRQKELEYSARDFVDIARNGGEE